MGRVLETAAPLPRCPFLTQIREQGKQPSFEAVIGASWRSLQSCFDWSASPWLAWREKGPDPYADSAQALPIITERYSRLLGSVGHRRLCRELPGYTYTGMRRILRKHVTMRNRGGTYTNVYPEDRA